MKIIEEIKSRRSVRVYKSTSIGEETLIAIAQAGLLAPSGMNRQAAEIICLRDKKEQERYKELFNKVNGRSGDAYYGAPDIILVLAREEGTTYICDGAVVLMNMMLQAQREGVGTCWIHHVQEVFKTQEGKELLCSWGLSTELLGIGSLALGYADGPSRPIEIRPDRLHVI